VSVDAERDRASLEEELVLADLVLVDTRLERVRKLERIGKKPENPNERALLEKLHEALGAGTAVRSLELSRDEEKALRGFGFLSAKPLLAVYNHDEGTVPTLATAGRGTAAVALPARAESEVQTLPEEERAAADHHGAMHSSAMPRSPRAAQCPDRGTPGRAPRHASPGAQSSSSMQVAVVSPGAASADPAGGLPPSPFSSALPPHEARSSAASSARRTPMRQARLVPRGFTGPPSSRKMPRWPDSPLKPFFPGRSSISSPRSGFATPNESARLLPVGCGALPSPGTAVSTWSRRITRRGG